ncbi:MAG: ABC transporter ATP-binding protein [Lachnospiraceae bacterium]
MKKLLRFLDGYQKESIIAPLFKMLEAILELLIPIIMACIIDIGIKNQDMGYIIKMILLMILLGVIGLICSVIAQYFAAQAAVGFGTKVRSALFSHIMKLSFSDQDVIGASTLITRMTSDINQVQSGVNIVLRLFLRSPFIVLGAMIMAFTIDPGSAGIFLITILLLSLVVFGILLVTIPMYKLIQKNLDRLLLSIRENLTGVRVLRAFRLEQEESRKYAAENKRLVASQRLTGRILGLMNPLTYALINLGIVILIYQGAVSVDTGKIQQGQLVALINYMSQILIELIKFATVIVSITKSFACADRIQSIFEMPAEALMNTKMKSFAEPVTCTETKPNTEPGDFIKLQQVSFRYPKAGGNALSDITFSVRKGQTIGILGGTGSGKTTLLHLMEGFYKATEGTIWIQERGIESIPQEQLREKMGIVPQKAVLFRGTIRSNLKWGKRDATDSECLEALALAQGMDILTGRKHGLDAEVEQGGKNFSGGQRQRLTIARALIQEPELLILDDSMSALDYLTEAALRASLHRLAKDPIVLIASQRASSVRSADGILVLDEGKMMGFGTHEELMQSCEVYREIYYTQFKNEEEGDVQPR